MQTYSVVAPLATHWRDATCEEAGCQAFKHGWRTVVPSASPLASEVRALEGRYHFVETHEDGQAVFTFPPGQACFRSSQHRVPLERDPLFLVRSGDWRGYGPARVHLRPGDWVDDFQESLDRVRDRQERG